MRRLVLCVSGCLALTVAACSGDTEAAGGTTQAPTGSPASVQADEAEEAPAELVPVVDRLDTGDDLLAGPGDEQLTLNAVASDGEVVIAAGELAQEDRNEREPVLFRSSDGREWERVDLSDSVPGDGYLAAVVTTSAGFLAVGNGDEGEPVALRSADGDAWEAAAVDFGDDADEGRVQVAAAAAAGDRVMVLGFALEGMSVEEGSSYTVELSTSISEDGGTSWQQGQVPDVEQAEEGIPGLWSETRPTLVAHGGGFLLGTGPLGPVGPTTALWSLAPGGDWTRIGDTADLFDDEPLELLHSTGDSVLAFTRSGGDVAAWLSTNDGVTFERLDAGPGVFAGPGTQAVDAAATLPDGGTVVAGRTMGEPHPLQRPTELELWLTADLEEWHRPVTDPALGAPGIQRAGGVVPFDGEALVVGTDSRPATDEELEESAYDPEAGGPPRLPPIARHGAVWSAGLREHEQVTVPAEVTPLEVRGFEGDTTVSDVVAHGGGLVAAGWVGEGDESRAAVWTSPDGQDWTEVSSHALAEPAGQRIYALAATDDDRLVAVGRTVDGDTNHLGAWTSPDGLEWARSEPEFASSTGYSVVDTPHGLVAAGTGDASDDDDVYRRAGLWVSTDGGATWSAADTTTDPFGESNVEFFDAVAVAPDGRIVAAGRAGEVEDPEVLSYRPRPFLVESSDGITWTEVEPPDGPFDSGLVRALAFAGDELVALGWASIADDEHVTANLTGMFGLGPDGWSEDGLRFRHRPTITASAPFAGGLVVAGEWGRLAGYDALIAVVQDGRLTFVDDELIADGDQHVAGAAALADDVVVLGLDTSGDEAAVLGWAVTLPAEEGS